MLISNGAYDIMGARMGLSGVLVVPLGMAFGFAAKKKGKRGEDVW